MREKRDYGETCSNAIMKALNNSLWGVWMSRGFKKIDEVSMKIFNLFKFEKLKFENSI